MSSSEWKEVKLREVINFKNGKKKPNDTAGDIPIYGGNGILGYTNEYNNEDTVVIGRVGAYCGSVYFEPNKCWISDNAISAKPLAKNEVKYTYYVLQSLKLNERRIGTGQPLLTQGILNDISTIYPIPEEQKAIADTLSCLDKKIELNSRISETLEELAQAIFKSWFVDFEPFQDGEFEASELGRIPKGWRVEKLDNVIDIKNRSINPGKMGDTVLEHYSIPAYDNVKMPIFEKATEIKSNKFIVDKNCFLVSKLNPATKRYWKPFCISENAVCSTEFIVYSSKIEGHLNFYFLLMDESRFFNFLTSNAIGSTNSRQRITPSTTLDFDFVCPPNELIVEFVKIVDNLFFQINQNILENQTQTTIRDTLLPKLMSGEIRVPIEEVQ